MSTLQVSIPASQMPKASVLARIAAAFNTAVEVFAEAQKRASEMQRKYPFVAE
jgi:hypothetical protein